MNKIDCLHRIALYICIRQTKESMTVRTLYFLLIHLYVYCFLRTGLRITLSTLLIKTPLNTYANQFHIQQTEDSSGKKSFLNKNCIGFVQQETIDWRITCYAINPATILKQALFIPTSRPISIESSIDLGISVDWKTNFIPIQSTNFTTQQSLINTALPGFVTRLEIHFVDNPLSCLLFGTEKGGVQHRNYNIIPNKLAIASIPIDHNSVCNRVRNVSWNNKAAPEIVCKTVVSLFEFSIIFILKSSYRGHCERYMALQLSFRCKQIYISGSL